MLPCRTRFAIQVLNPAKRPVSAVADHTEFRSVAQVDVAEDASIDLCMLFDPDHALGERILAAAVAWGVFACAACKRRVSPTRNRTSSSTITIFVSNFKLWWMKLIQTIVKSAKLRSPAC